MKNAGSHVWAVHDTQLVLNSLSHTETGTVMLQDNANSELTQMIVFYLGMHF